MPPKKRGRGRGRGKKSAAPIEADAEAFSTEVSPPPCEEAGQSQETPAADAQPVETAAAVDVKVESDTVESDTAEPASIEEEPTAAVTEVSPADVKVEEPVKVEEEVAADDTMGDDTEKEDNDDTEKEDADSIVDGADGNDIEVMAAEEEDFGEEETAANKTGEEEAEAASTDAVKNEEGGETKKAPSTVKSGVIDFTDDKVFDRYVRENLICKAQLRREMLNCARMKTIIIYPVQVATMFEEPIKTAIEHAYKYSFSADDRFVQINVVGVLQLTYHKVSVRDEYHTVLSEWAKDNNERFVSTPELNIANVRNKNEIKVSHSEVDEESELDYFLYIKNLPKEFTEEKLNELIPGSVDISFGYADDNSQRDYAIMVYPSISSAKETAAANRGIKLEDGKQILVVHYGSLAIPPRNTDPLPNDDRFKVINNYTRLKREYSGINHNDPEKFHENQAAQFRIEYAMARLKHDAENRVKAGLPSMTLNQVNHKNRGINKMGYNSPIRGGRGLGYTRGPRGRAGYEAFSGATRYSPRGHSGGSMLTGGRGRDMGFQAYGYNQNYGYNTGYQQGGYQQDYSTQRRSGGFQQNNMKRRGGGGSAGSSGGGGDYRGGHFKKTRY